MARGGDLDHNHPPREETFFDVLAYMCLRIEKKTPRGGRDRFRKLASRENQE
jgi:hypothetical protein